MKLKNMTTGLALVIIFFEGVLANAPACIAGGARYSSSDVKFADLSLSPFKGPSTAPVVITVFSDFQ
jgi:hypothetical protein